MPVDLGRAQEPQHGQRDRHPREQLYEQVWTTPLVRLAVQYGVSNVALGKTCRRLNIPTPGRGYWARLAAGEKLKRTPLPKAKGNEDWIRMTRDPDAKATEPGEKPPAIEVADTFAAVHDVVRRIGLLLRKARVDEHEQLVIGGGFLVVTAATHNSHQPSVLVSPRATPTASRSTTTSRVDGCDFRSTMNA